MSCPFLITTPASFTPHPSHSSSSSSAVVPLSCLPPLLCLLLSFYLHTPLKLPLLFHLSFILSFSTLCPLSLPKLPLFSHPSPSSSSPASLTLSCPQIFLPALVSSSPPPPSLPRFCFRFFPLSFLPPAPIFPPPWDSCSVMLLGHALINNLHFQSPR